MSALSELAELVASTELNLQACRTSGLTARRAFLRGQQDTPTAAAPPPGPLAPSLKPQLQLALAKAHAATEAVAALQRYSRVHAKKMEDLNAAVQRQLTRLEQRLGDAEGGVQWAQSWRREVDGRLDELQNAVGSLKAASQPGDGGDGADGGACSSAPAARVEAVEQQMEEMSALIFDLRVQIQNGRGSEGQEEVSSLQQAVAQLQRQVQALSQQTLEDEVARISAEMAALRCGTASQAEVVSLQQAVVGLTEQLEQLAQADRESQATQEERLRWLSAELGALRVAAAPAAQELQELRSATQQQTTELRRVSLAVEQRVSRLEATMAEALDEVARQMTALQVAVMHPRGAADVVHQPAAAAEGRGPAEEAEASWAEGEDTDPAHWSTSGSQHHIAPCAQHSPPSTSQEEPAEPAPCASPSGSSQLHFTPRGHHAVVEEIVRLGRALAEPGLDDMSTAILESDLEQLRARLRLTETQPL